MSPARVVVAAAALNFLHALKLAGGGRDVSCSSGGGCCCMDYPEPSTQPESVLGKTGLDLLISFGGIFVLITCQ
jgi:uncharacterized protein (DUF779 family)